MRRSMRMTTRPLSAVSGSEGSQQGAKTFSQTHQQYFFVFRDFVAKHKFLRESMVYESIAKFCDYRLGVVMDIGKPARPSVLDELIELQQRYSTLLVAHGNCQEDYMNKSTAYDNAKSNLLMKVQPSMERARSTFYSVKGKFDDTKDQHNSLLQQIQVRKDAQKAQMEYENLKIEIQEGYMADVELEISKNNDAIKRSREVYGDGDLLREIMPRLQQIGQKAESRKRALQLSIDEMKRLRDKITERNEMEALRDASLLKASAEPMAAFEKKTERALQSYESEKKLFAEEKELVDALERQKNKLASEMAAMASRISLVVNHKFDKSQDISDYNVSLSTIITFINLIVACLGVAYHSHLRTETKRDVQEFIASVKREAALESEVRDDMKELVRVVSELRQSFPTSSGVAAIKGGSTGDAVTPGAGLVDTRDEVCQTVPIGSGEGLSAAIDGGDELAEQHRQDAEQTTLLDDLLHRPNVPAMCFAGVLILFKCATIMMPS